MSDRVVPDPGVFLSTWSEFDGLDLAVPWDNVMFIDMLRDPFRVRIFCALNGATHTHALNYNTYADTKKMYESCVSAWDIVRGNQT